ncbi:MAG TPA: ABC transporter permease [Gemmatimonadaceae bacterium]|nr:ABC transporter permease [Gemmatimonadaceae bacterium]
MFVDDLRYAARTLRNSPAFAATAIVTLALAIGASTAIFSVVNAVLLRPLPYGDADRLAIVSQDLRARGVRDFPTGAGDVPDLRAGAPAFEGIAAVQTTRTATFTDKDGQSELISAAAATTNIFHILQVPVVYGRNFTDNDGVPNQLVPLPPPGAPPAAQPQTPPPPTLPDIGILSYDFWQRKFGGDTAIVGRSITLGRGPVQIVGIASPRAELEFPVAMQVVRRPDVWTALRVNFETGSRQNVAYRLIGRLKPGATLAQARAQIDRVSADLRARFPGDASAGVAYRVEPMKQYLVANVRTALLALMGAVIFVLLIACANVANLLLVRASQRERELAVRAAIGGSPWMIVRLLLAESLLLASIAAVLGVGLAKLGIGLLVRLSPANLPRLTDISIDPVVLGFTILAALAAAVLFGLVPAIRASRPDLAQVLRASGRAPSLGGVARLRNAVIVAEVALSFVLLIGSGLMIRSFVALARTDPGFDPNGVLTFRLANLRIRSPDELQGLIRQVRDKLGAIPGVTAVTNSSAVPLDGTDPSARWGTQVAMNDPSRFRQGGFFSVMPGYFETMHTRLIAGRTFTEADNTPDSKVVILDDAAARLAFGNESAIGKSIFARVRAEVPEQYTVIGVVGHQRHVSLSGEEKEMMYFPAGAIGGFGTWIVRTSSDPSALGGAVRAAIASVNPQLIITDMRPMTSLVDKARSATRFALVLIGVFAAIAAVLAAVGLYGVLSSVVRLRTSEIGIRMAFGAQSGSIFRLVIGQGLRLSAVGIAIGLALALVATRVMTSMLVDVKPTDPTTFASMILVFLVVAALACWVPARRAAAMDPNGALRQEY